MVLVAVSSAGAEAEPTAFEIVGGAQEVADVVFVILGILLVGIVTRHLCGHIPVPYTVLLLVWGLIAGGVAAYALDTHSGWHAVNVGVENIAKINPNGLLLIFMPILIYGSAQSMDWHTVKKEFAQVFILASSGVVVSMCLTAAFIYIAFPFGWSWYQCFMFGALISATDPVAVVALLKEVGASKRLGTIIEGESLLNDGSAFVLFLIFKEYVLFDSCCGTTGNSPQDVGGCEAYAGDEICQPFTPAAAFVLFLRLSIGGPLMGIAFGLLMVLWLTYTYNDEIVEIFVTITGAYVTFYVSEDVLSVSGVLSVVSLGFFMAAFGRSKISPRVLHPLEIVWEVLEWGGNTLIFVLAGIIITYDFYFVRKTRGPSETNDVATWVGYGVLTYLVCMVVRAVSIVVHLPVLRVTGYGMTLREAVVIWWSGLRGAIGLALALIVTQDPALGEEFRFQVLLFTSTVVILSLLINGSLTKQMLKWLRILDPSPVKVEFLIHSLGEMEEYAEKYCSHLKTDPLIGNPDWDKVIELSSIDAAQLVDPQYLRSYQQRAPEDGGAPRRDIESAEAGTSGEGEPAGRAERIAALGNKNLKQADLVRDVRARLLHGIKATYGEGFHKGYISPTQMLELLSTVDSSLDNLDSAIHDWELLEPHARVGRLIISLQGQEGCWRGPLRVIPQTMLFEKLEDGIVLAHSYLYAHVNTRDRLQAAFDEDDRDSMDPETVRLSKNALQIVVKESQDNCARAVDFIKSLRLSYPEVTQAVKTKLVALTILHRKSKFADHLHEGGLIEDKDYQAIQRALIMKSSRLAMHRWAGGQLPEPTKLMHSTPLLNSLSEEDFGREVVPCARHVLFQTGQPLIRKGDNALSFFVVIRGSTKSTGSGSAAADRELTNHQGTAVGVTEMLLGVPRFRTVSAASIVEGFEIKADDFAGLMANHIEVEKVAWQICGATLALHGQEDLVGNTSPEECLSWFLKSEVKLPSQGEDVYIEGHCYLAYGSLSSVLGSRPITNTASKFESPRMLGPGFSHLQATSSFAVVLKLPNHHAARRSPLREQDILRHCSIQAPLVPRLSLLPKKSADSRGVHRRSVDFNRRKPEAGPLLSKMSSDLSGTGKGSKSLALQKQRSMDFMRRVSFGVNGKGPSGSPSWEEPPSAHRGESMQETIEERPGDMQETEG